MRLRFAIVLAALALAGEAVEASPSSVPDKARSLAEQGRAFYDAGEYGNAIAAYTEAYAIAPSPALLFNLAQAYRLRGSCDDAALLYRRFLAADPTPEARDVAAGHLVTVERCAQKLSLSIPLGPEERAAVPAAAAQQDRADHGAPGHLRQRVGIGLAIGGGLVLAAATYFTVDAINAERDVERGYAMGGDGRELAEIDRRGERSATLATWLGIGGGALVASGVTTYLLGRAAERSMPVAIAPRKGGAQVTFAWQF